MLQSGLRGTGYLRGYDNGYQMYVPGTFAKLAVGSRQISGQRALRRWYRARLSFPLPIDVYILSGAGSYESYQNFAVSVSRGV